MTEVHIPLTYQMTWNDGFGARGWKLDCSIGEESVIAATAETGEHVDTSVLIHDVLDHHLCGVGIGGHRNEAIALFQLGRRTGSDPTPDLYQIVREDILQGNVNGEAMADFLPAWLRQMVPPGECDGRSLVGLLVERMGIETLTEALVDHFLALGARGAPAAREHVERQGIEYVKLTQIGHALQKLLARADAVVLEREAELAKGRFIVGNTSCSLNLEIPALVYEEPVLAV